MKDKRHRTAHCPDTDPAGRVTVYCLTCDWRDQVDVNGLVWIEGMKAIYAARDAHEAESEATK